MLRKARGPFSLRALNIHSIAGGNYGKIENLSKSIFHLLMALSLTVSFCLGVNELKISFYETIHRESVQSILEFGFFSDWMDDIANLALIAFFVCIFLLELIGNWGTLRLRMSAPLAFATASCLLFLTGFRAFSFMLLVPAYSINLISGGGLRQFLNVSLYFFIALEVLSLLRWATYPLFRSEVYSDMTWFFSRFDSFLFYSFNSIFGNILILAFVFSFLAFIFPFISRVKVGNGRIGIEISKFGKSIDANQFNLKLPDEKILLLSSFLILLYLSYLPYFPSLNPSNKSVSVDIVFYADYLDKFKQLGLSGEGFDYLLGSRGERATAIFLTYLVSMVFSSSTEAVKASIFISSYLIALATYLSLKAATKKGSLAGLSAFLSVFSVQVIVGLYAGYLANMVAIPLLLLMMSCFSRAMKGEVNFFIPAVLLSTLALYSHPWSWAIYILAIFLLLPLNLVLSSIGLRKRYSRREAVMVLSFILINLALDLTKQMLLKSTGGVYAEYAITRNSLSISNIFLLNRNLDELRQILVGGYTSNVLIHALSIVGVIFLLAFNDVFFDGLFLILPIAAVPFIFVNEAIQSRLLFALPTNIYATLGLY